MNLAYVITAHKNSAQLLRLLRAIHAPGNTYVLHVDAKAHAAVHAAARDYAAQHPKQAAVVTPSESIIWGSWRLARAQIRAMAEALRLDPAWEYCINLTGQDYPLKTQPQIAAQLAAGPTGANYLEVLDFAKAGANPRKRLESWWIPWRGKMTRTLKRRPLPFAVYWGSNYFALTRAACEHLASSDASRRMQRTFRFALCSDELIFQNALVHSALKETIVNKTYRKLTWAGGSHPKTYTMADRDELLASDAWFARKFDPDVDATILDALDAHLRAAEGEIARAFP
ncbi:MAG TPA: beta-1,6-N-acetylglucosaminyltransferase [Tepidisphaeraceae bacterium]|nr:beta-1,6-N-acetylglucosaminyltransferase [Tepidisphaeraceae bacterium]